MDEYNYVIRLYIKCKNDENYRPVSNRIIVEDNVFRIWYKNYGRDHDNFYITVYSEKLVNWEIEISVICNGIKLSCIESEQYFINGESKISSQYEFVKPYADDLYVIEIKLNICIRGVEYPKNYVNNNGINLQTISRYKERNADLSLRIKEGCMTRTFKVHKKVLSKCFRSMKELRRIHKKVIRINDSSIYLWKVMLSDAYHCTLPYKFK